MRLRRGCLKWNEMCGVSALDVWWTPRLLVPVPEVWSERVFLTLRWSFYSFYLGLVQVLGHFSGRLATFALLDYTTLMIAIFCTLTFEH